MSTDGGRPIADAAVGIFGLGRQVMSDSAGRFLLTGVRFGSQRVEIRAIGYQPDGPRGDRGAGRSRATGGPAQACGRQLARSRREQQPGGAARFRHSGQRRRDPGRGDPRDPRPPPGGDRQSHARRLREQLRRRGTCHRDPTADHHQGALRLSGGRGPDPVHRLLQPQRPLRDQHPAGRTARGDQGPGHRRVRQRRGGRRGERLHPGSVAAPRGGGVPRGRQQHLCPRAGNGEQHDRPQRVSRGRERHPGRRLAGGDPLRPAERHGPLGLRPQRPQPAQDRGGHLPHRSARRRWERPDRGGLQQPPVPHLFPDRVPAGDGGAPLDRAPGARGDILLRRDAVHPIQ